MSQKRKMGDALKASLKTETGAVEDRFAKADSVLMGKDAPKPPKAAAPEPTAVVQHTTKPKRGEGSGELVIRDTFSMPAGDYKLIDQLRSTAAKQGHIHTKSAIVRAGLLALSSMPVQDLLKALDKVEVIKPGRKAG